MGCFSQTMVIMSPAAPRLGLALARGQTQTRSFGLAGETLMVSNEGKGSGPHRLEAGPAASWELPVTVGHADSPVLLVPCDVQKDRILCSPLVPKPGSRYPRAGFVSCLTISSISRAQVLHSLGFQIKPSVVIVLATLRVFSISSSPTRCPPGVISFPLTVFTQCMCR